MIPIQIDIKMVYTKKDIMASCQDGTNFLLQYSK